METETPVPNSARTKTAFRTAAFWERRHRDLGNRRSGGHLDRTEAENHAFYHRRLGMLHELLGGFGGQSGRNSLLDAGCGKGFFARALDESGYQVTGIDASPTAIAIARGLADPGLRFEIGDLTNVPLLGAFDNVICVDVLFHVLEDDHWKTILRNLASVVNPGGVFINADWFGPRPVDLGGYIRFRPSWMYEEVLAPVGFRQTASLRYGDGQNDLGFFRYERR